MKPSAIGFSVFVAVTVLTQYLAYQRYLIGQENELKKVVHEINSVKDRLKTSLSHSLSATKTLAFLITEYGTPKDFNKISKGILESNKYIDALELTRKGVITQVYPLKGNESAIGLDVLKDSLLNIEAYRAIEKKELYFAGPFELKQGGIAIVGRLPIFIDHQFYGFSVVLIKLSTLLKAAGIDNTQTSDFIYQLSKVNPTTHQEDFFVANNTPLDKQQSVSIEVPDGEWKLYVMAKDSHKFAFNSAAFSMLGLMLSVTGGLFFWHLARLPHKLNKLVEQKTLLADSIINSLPGIFYLYDRTGKFIRWNKNFEAVSGYNTAEISKMHPLDFFHDDEKQLLRKKIEMVFVNGVAEVTANFYTRNQQKIPYHFNGRKAIFDGTDYLIGMGIDITPVVEVENQLRARTKEIEELTAHLEGIREEERTRIAREIHDELGQQLTGLKIDTSWIAKRVTKEDKSIYEKLSAMISLIDNTIKTVRRIASELRPGILDDLGLIAALEWQSQEFTKRTGIPCAFRTDVKNFLPERNLATNIFRVYQEALTNITRHAYATQVETLFEERDACIWLTIKDNGEGFDWNSVKTKNSLGLVGMKERARIFQGEIIIKPNNPQGTVVILKVPCAAYSKTLLS